MHLDRDIYSRERFWDSIQRFADILGRAWEICNFQVDSASLVLVDHFKICSVSFWALISW